MKKIFLLLIAIITFFYCEAQSGVPGFIGKRFSASAGLMFFPAFNPTYNNHAKVSSLPIYGMNLIKHAQIDFAIKRTKTIGIDFQNMRTSDYKIRYYPISPYVNASARDVRYVYVNAIGINIKAFNESKGAIAPIGNYSKYGLNVMFVRSFDSLDVNKEYATKNIFPTFTFGFGKCIIVHKYLTLNYGIDCTVMLDSKMITAYYRAEDNERYYDAGFVRTRSMKFINAHVTLGYVF